MNLPLHHTALFDHGNIVNDSLCREFGGDVDSFGECNRTFVLGLL